MNRIYYLIFAVILLLGVTACEDLDTFPEGDRVTTQQKEEVLVNDPSKSGAGVNAIFAQFSQYMPNESAINQEAHSDFGYPSIMLFTDHNGYDLVSHDNGYNWNAGSMEFSDRLYTSRESQILWNDMYAIINMTNNVISSTPGDTEDPTSQFYLAQGFATRAFSYLVLAQLYQFNYVGHESSLCVPILTDENAYDVALEGGAPRATVEDVYKLINSDLTKAIDLLGSAKEGGVTRSDKRYIDQAIAYGLRARMHLAMQKWGEAASDASNAIETSTAKPAGITDVDKPTFMNSDEKNWMWAIIIKETDRVVTSGIVNWISHMGSLNYGYATVSEGKMINKALYEAISETDVRKGWWLDEELQSPNLTPAQEDRVDEYGYGPYTQVKFAPYKNEPGTSINSNDIPLMRIEEMYLIKAEAEAMSGGDGKSTLESFIKEYRDPEYVCNASSPTDIQEEVFFHRRLELWGEGLNWFDIMRLNKPVDRRGGGYPNATMVFNIPAGSDILLWRIPQKEIQANPNISEEDNNPTAPTPDPVPDF